MQGWQGELNARNVTKGASRFPVDCYEEVLWISYRAHDACLLVTPNAREGGGGKQER